MSEFLGLPTSRVPVTVQDHPARQGIAWIKEAWARSAGARPFFLGVLLVSLSPMGLELLAEKAIGEDKAALLGVGIGMDLLMDLLMVGALASSLNWLRHGRKGWDALLLPFRPGGLKLLAPLLPLFAGLSFGLNLAKMQENTILNVLMVLFGIFLSDALALRLLYALPPLEALRTSVLGRLLNFWALVVMEAVFLLALVVGLGVPAVAIIPLLGISFGSIYKA